MRLGCLSLLVAMVLTILLPLVLADMLASALVKLHLEPGTASALVLGIFAGSLINIPVKRIPRAELVSVDVLAVFGLNGLRPDMYRARTETVVAVNVGGCVIPSGLALYEMVNLVMSGQAIGALTAAILVNVFVCHRVARPVSGVGIVMPAIVPAVAAAGVAWLAAPANATPVAFVAGVLGPLIGADILNLRDVERIESGLVSIGGAGTFDGILLSGILALYLA